MKRIFRELWLIDSPPNFSNCFRDILASIGCKREWQSSHGSFEKSKKGPPAPVLLLFCWILWLWLWTMILVVIWRSVVILNCDSGSGCGFFYYFFLLLFFLLFFERFFLFLTVGNGYLGLADLQKH